MRDQKNQRVVRKREITHDERVDLAATGRISGKKEPPINIYNHERYADPTAYMAIRKAEKKLNRPVPSWQ